MLADHATLISEGANIKTQVGRCAPLDYADPAIAVGYPFVTVTGRAKFADGNSCTGYTYITGLSADVTKSNISVTFGE